MDSELTVSAKNLTLYIPAEVAKKMDKLQEVNWSKIARDAIETYIEDRLQTSISPETLSRLRKEKGEEFANGKKYVTEEIIPKVTYKKLARFFERVNSNAIQAREYAAAMEGNIPAEMLSLSPYFEEEALKLIKQFFGKPLQDATEQFAKGALSVLDETWKKLEKEK